ncbi:MAG TPA: MaoC/PaaZ C-terminal domain-containing protein [Kofleriaceae bacterium]|nr:MaoC/PaaZ C-terminal domain-containing protein [Kofleriaceae bacterium]
MNFDLVGRTMEPLTHSYTWKDCVLYALGVGARVDRELDFLFEASGPRVLPTFAVVPSFTAMLNVAGRLGANMAMVVHGEQTIRLHRAIPPNGTFTTTAEVKGIYDKGKGALAVVEAKTVDDKGAPVFDNVFSIFVRGAGGFGGDRGPETVAIEAPDRAPDFSITERTSPEQAAIYRLSGDLNPLHIAPSFASAVGFPRPILHGLCTYGFAGRAVVQGACGGDPSRLKSFAARFSAPVFPGDELTTSGWSVDGKWIVRTTNQDGKVVLSNAIADVS